MNYETITVKELKEYLKDKDDRLKILIESTAGEYSPVNANKVETHYSNVVISFTVK